MYGEYIKDDPLPWFNQPTPLPLVHSIISQTLHHASLSCPLCATPRPGFGTSHVARTGLSLPKLFSQLEEAWWHETSPELIVPLLVLSSQAHLTSRQTPVLPDCATNCIDQLGGGCAPGDIVCYCSDPANVANVQACLPTV